MVGISGSEESRMRIPPELLRAIEKPGGFSLLVKGKPGTGKTSLSLELLRAIGGEGIYLSTRVSPKALYTHFPWLEECIEPINVIDTSKIYIPSDYTAYTSAMTGTMTFPEVLARRIGEMGEGVTVVIDSWDAIKLQCEPVEMARLEALVTELVRERNINLILTGETLDLTTLDYLVDGIVIFNDIMIEYRRAREVEMSKLRRTRIDQPKYPFTLIDGRFQVFMPFGIKPVPGSPEKIKPLPEKKGFVSSGSADFDELLGGGFRRGTFNVFEVGDDISGWGYQAMLGFTMINSIQQGYTFVGLPCCGRNEERWHSILAPFVDEDKYRENVTVFEIHPEGAEPRQNMMPLKGESIEEDLRVMKEYVVSKPAPVVNIMGADMLELPYRLKEAGKLSDAIKEIAVNIATTKQMGNVDIVRVTPNLEIRDELVDMASTYFRLASLDRTVVLYGIKPETWIYNVDTEFVDGAPRLKLTPYV
ncbi:MAG: RAD55 family ATPase [Candidatus Syntropharchaeales archaeon]